MTGWIEYQGKRYAVDWSLEIAEDGSKRYAAWLLDFPGCITGRIQLSRPKRDTKRAAALASSWARFQPPLRLLSRLGEFPARRVLSHSTQLVSRRFRSCPRLGVTSLAREREEEQELHWHSP
jgi:hypothetical protein